MCTACSPAVNKEISWCTADLFVCCSTTLIYLFIYLIITLFYCLPDRYTLFLSLAFNCDQWIGKIPRSRIFVAFPHAFLKNAYNTNVQVLAEVLKCQSLITQ